MRRSIVAVTALAAAFALLATPRDGASQAAGEEVAARNLLAASYMDSLFHPAKGEDTEFFIRAGGVPNIFFLVDTSGSMQRLPPNGPAFLGGMSPVMPPAGIVGCGLDPVTIADPAWANNPSLDIVVNRRYQSPCGKAVDQSKIGATYAGHATDYAQQASVCPQYTPANSQATGAPGFDPDFYDGTNGLTISGGDPNLFARDLVFHDAVNDGPLFAQSDNNNPNNHNGGNGWIDTTVSPFQIRSNGKWAPATIAEFCAAQNKLADDTAAPLQGLLTRESICNTCMAQRGFYYDGRIQKQSQEGITDKEFPSLWYTGNYLHFFPPKFVIARKIVKDIIAVQSRVRMALARFSGSNMGLLKEHNPTCQMIDSGSNFDSNRTTYVNLVNDLTFNGGTPLAVSLFDIGRFYHSPGLPWFGGTHEKTGTSWESDSNSNQYAVCYSCQNSSIIVLTDGQPSADDGNGLPAAAATLAQADGGKYAGDTGTGILGITVTECPTCGGFAATATPYKDNLAKVAWYLHHFDVRDNAESTRDCLKNGGKQVLDLYTVGYATRQLPDANTILSNAAQAGGGLFVAAEDPSTLKTGLLQIFEEINGRSTSFSVATVSTLQTTTGHSVIVPRFDPSKSASWKGHLYRYELYSEFVNECDPTRNDNDPFCCGPGAPGDFDCDGRCDSVYLQDSGDPPDFTDPFFINEGGDGFFYRNEPDRPWCEATPACVASGKSCGDIGNVPARPWWDAGAELTKKRWKDRKVFTAVDANKDGRIDAADDRLVLDTTDATATAILPYLGTGAGRVCNAIGNRIESAGDLATGQLVRQDEKACAKAVVRWLLGADVFNEAGRKATSTPPWPPPRPDMTNPATVGDPLTVPPTPPNLPDQEQLPERPFKLGDVFHSSPVVVDAPLPLNGILCPNGLHTQCLTSLWATPTEDAADEAYDAYAESARFKNRRKVILVGSNGGLLHAFNGGKWIDRKDDPVTKGIDESQPPFLGYYDRSNPRSGDPDSIWAEELWAFLPPDLIAKLPLVLGGEHQLFVDGSAMVRDVWADGTTNGLDVATAFDDVKQEQEFHTVAVVGERRGGARYFALDLSNATKLPSEADFALPDLLWIYPQPDDKRSLHMGETYTDFLPVAPPVGPVRIKADLASGGVKAATRLFNGVTPYREKWIALLSGGFDPAFLRGRGVHMVDVWTGRPVWTFTYPESSAAVAADDPRQHLRYPVAATPGMLMWGPDVTRQGGLGFSNEGFFDTATFGDTGGQLWALRFHEPAELDASGLATNWFGARFFQMGKDAGGGPSFGFQQPFFYITSNTALPSTFELRTYAGTGDRYNLLDLSGGSCAPDNPRACLMRGCTVTLDAANNFLATPDLGKASWAQSEPGAGALGSSSTWAAFAGATVEGRFSMTISGCPSPEPNTAPTATSKTVSITCQKDGAGRWSCAPNGTPAFGAPLSLSNTANNPKVRNWYFSLRVFDQARPPFDTLAEAKAFDAARHWVRDTGAAVTKSGTIVVIDGATNPPTTAATETSDGWALFYSHGPTVVADGHSFTVNALDERTSSPSGLHGKLTWNTIQTSSGEVISVKAGCAKSTCTAEDRRVTFHYGADPISGASVLRDSTGALVRAYVDRTLVPAQGDQPTVFVNRKGQVLVGNTVVNPEKGASMIAGSTAQDAVTDLGQIEISETAHACRHATAPPPAGVCR